MSDYLDQYTNQIDTGAISGLRLDFHQKNLSNQWIQEWSSLKKKITDFKNKQNHISKPFYPTDDMEADFKYMRSFYEGVIGKIPEYS